MTRAEPDMFKTMDRTGYVPSQKFLNTFWRNTKTTHIYQVISYVFDADDDLWKIVYVRHEGNGQEYTRTPEGFFGLNSQGKPRFERAYSNFYTVSDGEPLPAIEDRHD